MSGGHSYARRYASRIIKSIHIPTQSAEINRSGTRDFYHNKKQMLDSNKNINKYMKIYFFLYDYLYI